MLAEFRRLIAPSGVLVAGFFDTDDDVAKFDHKVITAYRWPADVFSARLASAGFTEIEHAEEQGRMLRAKARAARSARR